MDQDLKDSEYFLEVVKVNQQPKWPRPESELFIGSQLLSSGFIQFWAYPRGGNRLESDLPPAEKVAQEHKTDRPAVLVDQIGPDLLELITVQGGHVWVRSESSLGNLEDNLSDLLEFSKNKFNISIEHFMTTDRVSEDAEKKLDQLENNSDPDLSEGTEEFEESGKVETEKSTGDEDRFGNSQSAGAKEARSLDDDQPLSFRPVSSSTGHPLPPHGIYAPQGGDSRGSKIWIILPILILAAVFIGALFFREQILSKISSSRQAEPAPSDVGPTPTETPTPTPTPSVDRGEYKIRVLNGTNESGAAATLGDSLKADGWDVVKVGNAPLKGIKQTIVRVKKEASDLAFVLVSDLKGDYEASVEASLKETETVDAEVVIGEE